jgi:hypothetical protein
MPDRRLTALSAGGAAGATLVVVLTGDPIGRLLAMIAAILLLGYVISDFVFSPRLVAGPEGITVRSPFTRAQLAWSDIEDVRADTRFRLGLRSTNLEVDTGSTLVVLSRRAIGTDPVLAAEQIQAVRPAS